MSCTVCGAQEEHFDGSECVEHLLGKLQPWRTDEPPRSVLLLTWVRGVKEHSGAMWTREGYWLMPWHGEDGWAAQFRNAACKHLDADTLDVVGWMPLPEQPK